MNSNIFENSYLKVFLDELGHLRISQKHGGVVVIPECSGKYALIQHSRNGNVLIEFPRGFIEKGESHVEGGERELKEELSLNSLNSYVLGELVTDSGLIADNIQAIVCKVEEPFQLSLQSSEGIRGCCFYTYDEIISLIKEDKIKDNFTLASLMLLQARNKNL
ncbi:MULTISPECIES: NUDIX hydrolase [unclassified Leclercia]|uniref:NUDIX hydrolase n=1 Tax=unclassified Leclercia TaxID=2627398 RepID=UPI000DF111DD|nr:MULTISPECIES: NUDIX domain-containing protein [unclassified Leclercia]AXF64521.1 NUDIX domain-containing protein [Leclercia sp. W17]